MSDQKRFIEIILAVITGLGKILFVDILHLKFYFIVTACLFWISYLIYHAGVRPESLHHWGFRRDNFRSAFMSLLPYALVAITVFFIYGLIQDTLVFNWHVLLIMLIYPLWGVIQQYLVVGLVAGNLQDQTKLHIPKWTIIIFTAILFSLVHFPSALLITGTFILALVYSYQYLRERNLWVLGLYHGWLGCLFYYFVLGRDPYVEVFGAI